MTEKEFEQLKVGDFVWIEENNRLSKRKVKEKEKLDNWLFRYVVFRRGCRNFGFAWLTKAEAVAFKHKALEILK